MGLSVSRVVSSMFAKCPLRYGHAFQENVNRDSFSCRNLSTLMTFYEKRLLCDDRERLAYTYKKSFHCNELNGATINQPITSHINITAKLVQFVCQSKTKRCL